MKFSLLLVATVGADLIGYNRGVNNAFEHKRAIVKMNTSNGDNRVLLVKYLLHLGRLQEAQKIMREVGEEQNGVHQTDRFNRYYKHRQFKK